MGKWSKIEEEKLRKMFLESPEVLCKEFDRKWRTITCKINRMGLKRNEWSSEEEELLKEVYEYGAWDDVFDKIPNRSKRAIESKAENLGLRRKRKSIKSVNPNGTKIINGWTVKEDEILKKLYLNENKAVILEKIPNRTWRAIVSRAGKLGLKRKGWSVEVDKKELYEKYFIEDWNIRQCEKYFRCSNQAILMRLREWYGEEFERKIKTIGMRYTVARVKSELEKEGYDLVWYKDIHGFIKTADYITISCSNEEHKVYKVTLSDFLTGYRCKECYLENNRGENHPGYNPELTDEERESRRNIAGYEEWRKSVYEKDNYTCQKCGDNKGGNLVAHHIESYNHAKGKRTDVENGITLCEECHKEFHRKYGYGYNDRIQLLDWMKRKLL